MAQRNLLAAADAVERHPKRAADLAVDDEETASWRDAAQAMLVPYDKALEVHSQAEGFTQHQTWDFEHTTPDQYPLLLHFPYFDLYRKQVVKQADLVLALHLRGDAFSDEEKARNFAYYERLTVRDSSLSACTQAVIAAEVGQLELAFDYLSETALIDIDDIEHNTSDGLHIASLAGTWIAIVAGLGGMRDHDGVLSFAPRLPQALARVAFRLCFAGRRLLVDVGHAKVTYTLLEGEALKIVHHGRRATVNAQRVLTRSIPALRPGESPSQPAGRAPEHRQLT
jgi:alpha,alpha-trehalose phosphorylase